MIQYTLFETAWGPFGLVSGARGLLATFLPGERADRLTARIRARWPGAVPDPDPFIALQAMVRDYFDDDHGLGEACDPSRFEVRLDLSGMTEFRRRVTLACRNVSRGQTISYAELARRAGSAGAVRAAGSVMADNPFGLIVPCHRVIRSDGSIGEFGGPDGSELKERLLTHEGALVRNRSGPRPNTRHAAVW